MILFGCSDRNKDSGKPQKNDALKDTTSALIKYDITGMGSGAITLTKYKEDIRIDLIKNLKEGVSKESRFISGGYVYYYVSSGNLPQPVKSKIIKDNNYQKSFSAFTDAGEFLPRMKKSGTEIVSGFACDVYNDVTDGSIFSIFGGKYVLKASFGGNVITANSVQINAVVDSNYAKVPMNVDFIDVTR